MFGVAADGIVNFERLFNKGIAIAISLSAIGLGVFSFAVSAILGAINRGPRSSP